MSGLSAYVEPGDELLHPAVARLRQAMRAELAETRHDDPHRPEPEWCEDCGCPRFVAEWDWEVDVNRDGPDGPEWQVAILDCDHDVTTGRKRSQRYA